MAFHTLNKQSSPALAARITAGKEQLHQMFKQAAVVTGDVAERGVAITCDLQARGHVIAEKAARTLDPVTPYQKVTPRVSATYEPNVKERVMALRHGFTFRAPIKPSIEKSPEDIAAIKALSGQVGINYGALGSYGANGNAFNAYREVHQDSHHAIIGAYESIERIARGEHDAKAARISFDQVQKLINPPEGSVVPKHVKDRAVVAARIFKAEMGGIRDIRDAGISGDNLRGLQRGFLEMTTQMRMIGQEEQKAHLAETHKALLSLSELKREEPKAPGQGFFSKLMRGFSGAADATYATEKAEYDQRVETLQGIVSKQPSKVAEYNNALINAQGYYGSLSDDLATQIDADKPSFASRITSNAKYAMDAAATSASSWTFNR